MKLEILFLLFLSSYSLFAQELCLVSDNQQLQELFRAVNNTVGEVQENLDVDALMSIVYDPERPLAERNAQVERLNSLPESVRPLSFEDATNELCGQEYYERTRNSVESHRQVFREIREVLSPEQRAMDADEFMSFITQDPDIDRSISIERYYLYLQTLREGYQTFNPLPSVEELTTIKLYTGGCYRGINSVLRGADPYNLYRYVNLFSTLNNLINHLPIHSSGMLRRWSNLPEAVLAEHRVGNIVRYAGVTSTTSSSELDLERFGCHAFTIEGDGGRVVHNISVLAVEREVIYPPGQCFLVTGRSRERSRRISQDEDCGRNAYNIHMRAVSCSTPPEREGRR